MADVAVAQHHSLGLAGGARSVENGGQVVGLGVFNPAVALEVFFVFLDKFQCFDVHYQRQLVDALLAEFVSEPFGDENHLALRVVEDVGHFVFRAIGQDRYGHTTESCGSKERQRPVGHVLR